MDKYLMQYVKKVDPFATEEDILNLEEINEWDLLIRFRNGRKVLYDRFTGYYKNINYESINEISDEHEMKEFTYRLRSLMGRRRITQKELADRIGTSQVMISRYMRGETMPSIIVGRKIAKVLGCSMDDLFNDNY